MQPSRPFPLPETQVRDEKGPARRAEFFSSANSWTATQRRGPVQPHHGNTEAQRTEKNGPFLCVFVPLW